MEEYSVALLLQQTLNDALEQVCSDVHVFTVDNELVIQFRVGENLIPYVRAAGLGPSMVRRIKALARMDVAETRLPQDGSFQWIADALEAAVRVASLPTVHGEAMVLRLLPARRQHLDFRLLGMTVRQSQTLHELLSTRTGLILVAGPTSSGKTTTLYAMMAQIARLGRRVVSIEDPVEQVVDNCHQLEVRERIGMTFDSGLRALLRQDPDVIMVGEIRDAATAKTAVRAALTGSLVLSTTHAEDVIGAVVRLVDLGTERSLVAEVLKAVIVQRLAMDDRRGSSATVAEVGIAARSGTFSIRVVTPELCALIASDLSWPVVRLRASTDAAQG